MTGHIKEHDKEDRGHVVRNMVSSHPTMIIPQKLNLGVQKSNQIEGGCNSGENGKKNVSSYI
jgi:hypothetical protein